MLIRAQRGYYLTCATQFLKLGDHLPELIVCPWLLSAFLLGLFFRDDIQWCSQSLNSGWLVSFAFGYVAIEDGPKVHSGHHLRTKLLEFKGINGEFRLILGGLLMSVTRSAAL